MMLPVMCVVQEAQFSPEAETSLKTAIADFTFQAFEQKADINWITVAKGNGFTAAKPSTTMVVSMHSTNKLVQEERVSLLKTLCKICGNTTGLSPNEVVASIRDPQ